MKETIKQAKKLNSKGTNRSDNRKKFRKQNSLIIGRDI